MDDQMGWVVLAVWAVVAAVAIPLGRHALSETPALGLQAALALAGLALAIVYVAGSDSRALAWVLAGIGVLGAIVVAVAAAWLTADRPGSDPATQAGEETDALLAGVELTLFATAGLISAVLAVNMAHLAV